MKRLLLYSICIFACWGCEDERHPQKQPSITNLEVTDITEFSATCTFIIESVGATQQAGVIYGTDATLLSGTTEASTTTISGGNISLTMSSLLIDTEYFYKVFIADKQPSFIYSEIRQFRTKPLIIDLSTTNIAASHQAGSFKFNITSNDSWTITSNQEWCTVQPSSGNCDEEITVSVSENATEAPRTATLTVTAGVQSLQVIVDQDKDNTTLEVSTPTINSSYTAKQHSFNITSNAAWTIVSNQEWCIVQPSSGNGDKEITVSVTENNINSLRIATLTVICGRITKKIYVTQSAGPAKLEVSPSSLSFSSAAQQKTFSISSNTEWSITKNGATWFSVSSSNGSGDQTITVAANANESTTQRTATITVTGGGITRTISVTQIQKITEPEMVLVQGGIFTMGCTGEQGSYCSDLSHLVTVSSFNIGKYEVTEGQWKDVMGSNPSYNVKGENYPVEYVSWNDIVGTSGGTMVINGITYYADGFIYKLNQLTGKRYRLPTEAEWEYAARGGSQSKRYIYSGSNTIGNVAWYRDNSGNSKHAVGTKSPNELGLYDMSGNVWEWCSDWYENYSSSSQTNPQGPSTGSYHVFRGGSWGDMRCYVSFRYSFNPVNRSNDLGFRVVLPL